MYVYEPDYNMDNHSIGLLIYIVNYVLLYHDVVALTSEVMSV